jgi:hypothetical protein
MYWFLECKIEWQNIIVANAIVWKVPKEWTDAYDLIVWDHFNECDESKKYVIEEFVSSQNILDFDNISEWDNFYNPDDI